MTLSRWLVTVVLALVLAAASEVRAQRSLQDPHIGYVYPAGGQANTSFEVTVGGEYLKGPTVPYISGGGVRVWTAKYYKHLSQGEYNGIQNKLRNTRMKLEDERKNSKTPNKLPPLTEADVRKAAGVTDEDLEKMADYRKRMAQPKRQLNPQLMEEVTMKVELAADAKPGIRELRLIAPSGMSNPAFFQVGQIRAVRETEPNDRKPDVAALYPLPVVINGQIMPGDVDRFSFRVTRGTRLVIVAAARELIPYLADAVPGWFQAVLALYDAKGHEVGYANAFGYQQDPVLYYEVPKDGEYVVEIRDAIFRGREDFVYRITIGELPFVTSIFPLGGRAGTQLTVELKGWNLPIDKLDLEPVYDRGHPIRSLFTHQHERMFFNRVPFAVDMLPECLEQEPNNTPATAQAVTLPIIVNGRIDPPGDRDVFRFEGHDHEHLVAEVYARRLGSPLDSLLRLTDANGKEIAVNDDYEDKSLALSTHHADSRISVSLPATGTYYLYLSDAQRKGGPDYAYRLQIRPPRPDFELRVVPSSIIATVGTTVPITAYALRKDGFADDIMLDLENPPPGFTLSGAWVPAGQDQARLTLTVPPVATRELLNLQMEGRVVTHGRRIIRPAIPAEAMTQAFAYQHLVPANDWTIAVVGRNASKPSVWFTRPDRLKLPAGESAQLNAGVAKGKPAAEIRLELSEPPEGITIQSVTPRGDGLLVVLRTDAKKVKPGLKGNLIFNAVWERAIKDAEGKLTGKTYRTPLGMLPAIPFEVGGKQPLHPYLNLRTP
jgi:hypothetical protein